MPGAGQGCGTSVLFSACRCLASPSVHQLEAPRTPPWAAVEASPHRQGWLSHWQVVADGTTAPSRGQSKAHAFIAGWVFSFSREHWHSRHGRHEGCLPGHRWPPTPSPCSCVGCCRHECLCDYHVSMQLSRAAPDPGLPAWRLLVSFRIFM